MKVFQQLSVEVTLSPLGNSSGDARTHLLECKIDNKVWGRVHFKAIKYQLRNVSKRASEEICPLTSFRPNLKIGTNAERWSVDAASSAKFSALVKVPVDASVVEVSIEFQPKCTRDTYLSTQYVNVGESGGKPVDQGDGA